MRNFKDIEIGLFFLKILQKSMQKLTEGAMKTVLKETIEDFPFDWANLDSYRESFAHRKEIYLKDYNRITEDLIILFYYLFGSTKVSEAPAKREPVL